jgi:FAD:protein FMN transferase
MIKPLITLISICLLIGCAEQPNLYSKRVLSFGTLIDVTISGVSEQEANQAIAAIEKELDIMHVQWHAWRPGNLLKLNQQLQSGEPFSINPAILPLVEQSQTLSQISLGYFNPAIGKLVDLWGFHRDNPELNKKIPSDADILPLVNSNPTMNDISITGTQVQGFNKDIQLDFGGYAKGYGLEVLVKQLQRQNIDNALINAGGDIKAIGSAGTRAWKVAIKHPIENKPIAWLELEDGESIFTSGDYIRAFIYQGKRYHHIIDPQTGFPSRNARAVTVIHKDAAVADAAATALMVAPKKQWLQIAKSMQLEHLLIVDRDLQLYVDGKFMQRLNQIDTALTINLIGTL